MQTKPCKVCKRSYKGRDRSLYCSRKCKGAAENGKYKCLICDASTTIQGHCRSHRYAIRSGEYDSYVPSNSVCLFDGDGNGNRWVSVK